MKNQWTTVSDSSQETQRKTEAQKTPGKNKTIALAMASLGVFLIIAGAAPFFFSGNDSSDYSAFLGTNSQSEEAEFYIDTDSDVTFEDGEEIVSEPVEIEVSMEDEDISEMTEPEEVQISLGDLMEPEGEEIIVTIPEIEFAEKVIEEETTSEKNVSLEEEKFTEPEIILDDGSDTLPESEVTVITETNDFPINTYTGETVDPIVLARTATAEQLHGVAKENPETGLPLLPILMFSAGTAILVHRKKLLNTKS